MRILYLSAANSPHDDSYLRAICPLHDVTVLSLHGGRAGEGLCERVISVKMGRAARLALGHRILREFRGFDLYIAVYLSTYGFLASRAGLRPLLSIALGSDIIFHNWRLKLLNAKRTKIALEHSDVVVLPTTYAMEAALSLGARREKLRVVRWGVDLSLFSPIGHRMDLPEGFKLIHNRTLAGIYDPISVIEAWALARERMDEGYLVLIGRGPLRGKVLSLARRLGVGDSLLVLDWLPYERMPSLLRAGDAFITLSLGDAQARSILEAMAVGLPVVVSNTPGNEGTVQNGVNGYVVGMRDPAGAARAILKLWENGEVRRFMGAAGRVAVQEAFDWRETVRRHLEIIESLRSPRSRSPS